MKLYIVYFEIYGKKLRTEVPANSVADAKEKVKSKIIFHKVEEDLPDIFKTIFSKFH